MENNNQKNQMQQSSDKMNIGEAKETGKEALKLGANAASGNWAGAAKNALNLAKNKKVRRKIIIHALLQILVPIIIVVIVATSIFSIGVAIKDTLIELGSKVSTGLAKMWQWLTNDYWIDLSKGTEYIIDAETGQTLGTEEELKESGQWNGDGTITDDEGNIIEIERRTHTIVENYIKELGNKGVSISDLRLLGDESTGKNFEELMADPDNKELIEKYISEFVRADIITQQFHKTRGKEVIATDGHGHENVNKVDGGVYLYRTKIEQTLKESDFNNGNFEDPEVEVTQKEYKQMEYIDIEDFQEMVTNDDKNIRYKFSLDKETDELLVAKITETKKVVQSTKPGESSNESTYEIEEIRLPYKDYISKYTMPYEFLINLCEITQNPEFVYHVALLARDTEIILAIQDDTTIEKTTVVVEEDMKDYINYGTSDTAGASVNGERTEETETVTTITTQTPRLLVEYADTWSFYEESTYTKSVIGTKQEEGPVVKKGSIGSTLSNFHPATDTEPKYWTDTFTTETRTTTKVLNLTTIYNPPIITSVEKSKQFLGLLRNETGECPYDCYEKNKWDNAKYCVQEAVFDEEGYNVSYKIPNMERYEMPLNKLQSGLEMLYAMLQSNTSGYNEDDKLISSIEDSYDAQQDYIANEDYESAYVVKMQGLVEHLRYLMTFPDEKAYTKLDLNLENWSSTDSNSSSDIILDEGTVASAREIYDFLLGKGMTPEAACAILGNIQRESSFLTSASNGTHFGLCQWGKGRWRNLKSFAMDRGTLWTDLNTQLEFLWSELEGQYSKVKDKIINSTDLEYATEVFCKEYEVCGNYGTEVPTRCEYAQNWYNRFVNGVINEDNLTDLQNKLLNILEDLTNYSGIINDDGYCQAFVRSVFEKIGITASAASASKAEEQWKVSNDINNIPIGATVYGEGSNSDGHVGIYIGNGMVVHNIGNSHDCSYGGLEGIKCESISSWDDKYTFTSWGWQGGVALVT